eukprot:NODE_668_length_5368_cov_0.471626.p3 type:complete len:209 gc:universal NODE_668_length_5368_cov_0.471626:2366-1740(-)
MLFTVVFGHFTLIGSREQAKWPASNERFWPIGGGAVLRSVTDCLQLPATKPTVVPSGPYTIHWEIGNGAHHVGQCDAYLIDTKTGASEHIGSEDNCVSTKQALTVDLSKHSCTSCVIKATVAADHLVTSIESYDSCMDVTFDGTNSPTIAVGTPAAIAAGTPSIVVPDEELVNLPGLETALSQATTETPYSVPTAAVAPPAGVPAYSN